MLKFSVLGSSSAGNCTYVATDKTAVLVDAGLSARETCSRLANLGATPRDIQGVLVTHEHSDHTSGLRVLQRRYGVPLYANSGTIEGYDAHDGERLAWRVFTTGAVFPVGDMMVEPFSVPHDTLDPVGFLLHGDGATLGVVTDMGITTTLIRARLRRCAAIVIESNHDVYLLRQSKRPWPLKQRILGPQGHLSNDDCAALVTELAMDSLLQLVVLAHLSCECNEPGLARRVTEASLRQQCAERVRVVLAAPDMATEVLPVAPRPVGPGRTHHEF